MEGDTLYAITWRTPEDGSVTTLKARKVGDSELGPGFICVWDFAFDTGSRLVDPAEEALARRYEHTRRLHLNVFSIQSIAEVGVDHPGLKLEQERSNLVVLPPPRPPKP